MSHTMLYKYPGSVYLDRDKYDYIIVPSEEVADRTAEGWARTPAEAKAQHEARQEAASARAAAAGSDTVADPLSDLIGDEPPARTRGRRKAQS